jgi:hypothetical protein
MTAFEERMLPILALAGPVSLDFANLPTPHSELC